MLIIEFPCKYSVFHDGARTFTVHIPLNISGEVMAAIKCQPWIADVFNTDNKGRISVYVSYAYEVSTEQAISALSRICEHIMEPQPEMDTALEHELEELL